MWNSRMQWWVISLFVTVFVAATLWGYAAPAVPPGIPAENWGLTVLGACIMVASYIIRYGLGAPTKKNEAMYNEQLCKALHKAIEKELAALWHSIEELRRACSRN